MFKLLNPSTDRRRLKSRNCSTRSSSRFCNGSQQSAKDKQLFNWVTNERLSFFKKSHSYRQYKLFTFLSTSEESQDAQNGERIDNFSDTQRRNSSNFSCESSSLNNTNALNQEFQQPHSQHEHSKNTPCPNTGQSIKEISTREKTAILSSHSKSDDNQIHTIESFPQLASVTSPNHQQSISRQRSFTMRTTLPPIEIVSCNSTIHRSQSFPQMSNVGDDHGDNQERTDYCNYQKQVSEHFDQSSESGSRAPSVLKFNTDNNITDDQLNITKNWNLFRKVFPCLQLLVINIWKARKSH